MSDLELFFLVIVCLLIFWPILPHLLCGWAILYGLKLAFDELYPFVLSALSSLISDLWQGFQNLLLTLQGFVSEIFGFVLNILFFIGEVLAILILLAFICQILIYLLITRKENARLILQKPVSEAKAQRQRHSRPWNRWGKSDADDTTDRAIKVMLERYTTEQNSNSPRLDAPAAASSGHWCRVPTGLKQIDEKKAATPINHLLSNYSETDTSSTSCIEIAPTETVLDQTASNSKKQTCCDKESFSKTFSFEIAIEKSKQLNFTQQGNFCFLESKFPKLYEYAVKAEKKYYEGLHESQELDYCVLNIGKFTERLIRIILNTNDLESEFQENCRDSRDKPTLFNRINFLFNKGFPSQLVDILHKNRIGRNPATHDGKDKIITPVDCESYLRNIYVLSKWLVEKDNNFHEEVKENETANPHKFAEDIIPIIDLEELKVFPEDYLHKKVKITGMAVDWSWNQSLDLKRSFIQNEAGTYVVVLFEKKLARIAIGQKDEMQTFTCLIQEIDSIRVLAVSNSKGTFN